VQAGDFALAPVALRVTNSAGRAVFDIDRIGVFDGAVSGDFVVNGRGGLSVRGDLNLVNMQLSPMMAALVGNDRLDGTGNAAIRFLGVGNDMATLMASLDGDGDLALGAGAIIGLDLAGMIRTLDASFQGDGARTVYDSLTAAFTITEGVLRNDDLLLDAPWGEVAGAGRVDLGAQTLDYRVIPTVMRDASGSGGINVPILFSGPWASLSIRPDLEYLAQQELAEEAERLEAEARARLAEEADRLEAEARARANEALGLDLQEGDTVEDAQDALEQRLRDEAEDQLRRLLGGGN
jgi:AsmA protein